jgi:hypothetical protein
VPIPYDEVSDNSENDDSNDIGNQDILNQSTYGSENEICVTDSSDNLLKTAAATLTNSASKLYSVIKNAGQTVCNIVRVRRSLFSQNEDNTLNKPTPPLVDEHALNQGDQVDESGPCQFLEQTTSTPIKDLAGNNHTITKTPSDKNIIRRALHYLNTDSSFISTTSEVNDTISELGHYTPIETYAPESPKTWHVSDGIQSSWKLDGVAKLDVSLTSANTCNAQEPVEEPITACASNDDIDINLDKNKQRTAKILTPRKAKLKMKLRQKSDAYNNLKKQLSYAKKQIPTLTRNQVFEACCTYVPKSFIPLLRMNLLHARRTKYKDDEKQFSLNAQFKAPRLCDNWRDEGIVLPHRSTILSWVNKINLRPGISSEHGNFLRERIATLNERQRHVTLMLDDIVIKSQLSYDQKSDSIEGYQDLGHLGRKPVAATHITTFMVRGIADRWKLPISFYPSKSGIKCDDLQKLIKYTVTMLFKFGLYVRALVCDQATTNRSAIKKLGATPEAPYFTLHGKKIYVLYDTCHLIKSIRNNLYKYNFRVNGKIVSWKTYIKLYNIDSKKNLKARSCIFLKERHIRPTPFTKMKVLDATQIFSGKTAAAILTAVKTGELKEVTAKETAEFTGRMNRLFDALNSRHANPKNPQERALSEQNYRIKSELQRAIEWLNNIDVLNNKQNPPCIVGLIMSITAILALWDDLKTEGWDYLLTSRLTQDALENFFAMIRQRGGFRDNPSVQEFRYEFRWLLHMLKMNTSKLRNCDDDEDRMLISASDITSNDNNVIDSNSISGEAEEAPANTVPYYNELDEDGENSDEEINNDIPNDFYDDDDWNTHSENESDDEISEEPCTLEHNAVCYYSGYILGRLMKNVQCVRCRDIFEEKNRNLQRTEQTLTMYRAYPTSDECDFGHLVPATLELTRMVNYQLGIFVKIFPSFKCKIGLKEKLYNYLCKSTKHKYPKWFNDPCCEHREILLRELVKSRTINEIKWDSLREVDNKRKKRSTRSLDESEGLKMHHKIRKLRNL